MPVFNKAAYLAACHDAPPPEVAAGSLTDAHFDSYELLDEALSWLSDEQRCDALYADHIVELGGVSVNEKLAIRNLVVGQGALDANYLAELAQNADDASDGKPAEVNVRLQDGWLLFGNNGRKITAGNLRGLTRFFTHDQPITEETIGRFGIGFKSCYRIATEVFVLSRDTDGAFVFRLPISKPEYPESLPDRARLRRIVDALRSQGVSVPDANLSDDRLGYCTPEFVEDLPEHLRDLAEALTGDSRGSLFCLHLHARGRSDVEERLPAPKELFTEVCPLFLPHLVKVSVGQHTLSLHRNQRQQVDCIAGLCDARRVVLTSENEGEPPVRQRLWVFTGTAAGDVWQLALHADSDSRIVKPPAHGIIASGGAYAFFPLSDENRSWPVDIHLHVNCPTTLSRGSWSEDDRSNVDDQVRRSAEALATWLEVSEPRLHGQWSVHDLFRRQPEARSTAGVFYEALVAAGREHHIYRTLWGTRANSGSAVSLSVNGADGFQQSWAGLVDDLRRTDFEHDIIPAHEHVDFGIPCISSSELKGLFDVLVDTQNTDVEYWQNVFLALLSLKRPPQQLFEYVMGRIRVEKHNGTHVMLRDLLSQQAGAELVRSWHATFKNALNWCDDLNRAVCGNALAYHLRRLSVPQAVIEWADLKTVLASQDDWDTLGGKFWSDPHDACPGSLRGEVLQLLHVMDGSNRWKPLPSMWALDGNPLCMEGAVTPWERGQALNDSARRDIVGKLKAWGLFDDYVNGIEDRLTTVYPNALHDRLTTDGFRFLTQESFAASLSRLEPRWQALVKEGVEEAVTGFLNEQCDANVTLLSLSVPRPLQDVISWLPEYSGTPEWLTLDVEKLIGSLRFPQDCRFSLLSQSDLTVPAKRELAKRLLANLYRWDTTNLTEKHIAALTELFRDVTGTWEVRTAPGTPKHLSQFIDYTSHAGPEFTLLTTNNGDVDWRDSAQLPDPLPQIPSIESACITLDGLTRKVSRADDIRPISWDELTEAMQQNESILRIRSEYPETDLVYTSSLSIGWFYGQRKVCEITDAIFALDEGHLYVSKAEIASGEAQAYSDVISNYLTFTGDGTVDAYRNTHPPAATYGKFRERILKTFRREFVSDAGYKIEHVLRELLQNAESAYASQREGAGTRPFNVRISERSAAGMANVTIEHHGRSFNEPDKTGAPRDDIRRIVSTAPIEVAVEDEVGRFNRGFKSVFTVTESVHVSSGGYEFDIRDFLLVFPRHPTPKEGVHEPETAFHFDCRVGAVDDMLEWRQAGHGETRVGVFDEFAFVFLRYVTSVEVTRGRLSATWTMAREKSEHERATLTITASGGKERHFAVFSSSPTGFPFKPHDRVDVAVQIGSSGFPEPVEDRRQLLYITFPTSSKGSSAFLVNAPFDVDPGRIGILPNARNAGLIKTAFSIVLDETRCAIKDDPVVDVWLAWTAVWDIRDAKAWVKGHFPDDTMGLGKLLDEVKNYLLDHVPQDGGLRRASSLVIPSRLMRSLAEMKGDSWPLNDGEWVSHEVSSALLALADDWSRYRLPDFVDDIRYETELLEELRVNLADTTFVERFGKGIIERQELDAARDKLTAILDVEEPPVSSPGLRLYVEPDYRPERSAEELHAWWVTHENLEPYVLEGEWWDILCPGIEESDRREYLRRILCRPGDADGQLLWYKVLSVPCLMSTGRRVSALRDFWAESLNASSFFEQTAEHFGGEETKKIFLDAIHRRLRGDDASGEQADFWRRVFYDIRKIRTLVYENDFAEVIMELASDAGHVQHLIRFLRNGTLPGQKSWTGVIGQSAGGPLFFVMRELRRLGVIESTDADPSCYFVCKPVRRAAYELGWLDRTLRDKYDFASLQEVSFRIHAKISGDVDVADELLPLYDIPLLHYDQMASEL